MQSGKHSLAQLLCSVGNVRVLAAPSSGEAKLDDIDDARMETRQATEVIADALTTLLRTPAPPFASLGAGALKVVQRLWECARSVASAAAANPTRKEREKAVMVPVLRALLIEHAHEPSRPAVAALARSLASADIASALDVAREVFESRPAALKVVWTDWAQAATTEVQDEEAGSVALIVFAIQNVRVLDLVESGDDVNGGRLWVLYEALLNACFSSSRIGVIISRLGEALSEAVSASVPGNGRELIVFARLAAPLSGMVAPGYWRAKIWALYWTQRTPFS